MSHFSRIRTVMVSEEFLIQALRDLGYEYEVGDSEIRGFGSSRTVVDIRVRTKSPGYDIGFRKSGRTYEVVADWWGINDIRQEKFMREVTQRYAYHAARATVEAGQDFSLVTEEVDEEGRIHLVLRRMI